MMEKNEKSGAGECSNTYYAFKVQIFSGGPFYVDPAKSLLCLLAYMEKHHATHKCVLFMYRALAVAYNGIGFLDAVIYLFP